MLPKNIQVGLSVVASSFVAFGLGISGEGDVEEVIVLQHAGADPLGEFFDLLFDVG